ncbi:MAG: patatin-like phospholipase family protein [Myxococcota bacterium]
MHVGSSAYHPLVVPVALEGCACRAAFHVGVTSWMVGRGLTPPVVAGASSGALVGAVWAVGRVPELREAWLEMAGTARVFEPRRLLRGRWPGRMSHLLRDRLDEYGHLRMSDVPALRVAITRLGLRGPRRVVLDARSDVSVVDAVLASCFIPGPYSRPVVVGRRFAVDGAWFERVPVGALPVGRAIAVVSDPRGRIVGGWPRERTLPVSADVRVLAPLEPLPLSGFDFDGPGTRAAIAIGEASAEAFVRANERWMTAPHAGVGEWYT